jgi:hypothetical protein
MKQEQTAGEAWAGITQNREQAQVVLKHLFETYSIEDLKDQIMGWLQLMPAKVIMEFNRLPETLQTTRHWLLGDEETPPKNEKELAQQRAALFGFLIYFFDQCWLLFGRDIHEQKAADWNFTGKAPHTQLTDLLKSITLTHAVNLLYEALVAVTGNDYQIAFQSRIRELEYATEEEMEQFGDEPAGEYTRLMVMFAHFRSLMDATWYLLYNN